MGDPRKIGKRKLLERLKSEPKARRGLPECPALLTGNARECWKFVVGELEAMEMDFRADAILLTGLCLAYKAAMNGRLAAWDQVNRLAANFPLSSVARRRLASQESATDPEHDLLAVLSAPREKRAASVQ